MSESVAAKIEDTVHYSYSRSQSSESLIIFFWSSIGKNRGSFLNKIYGYNSNGKKYKGLIEKLNGRRLGKSCVMIPAEHKEKMFELIKKHDVDAKFVEVFSE